MSSLFHQLLRSNFRFGRMLHSRERCLRENFCRFLEPLHIHEALCCGK